MILLPGTVRYDSLPKLAYSYEVQSRIPYSIADAYLPYMDFRYNFVSAPEPLGEARLLVSEHLILAD